MQQLELDMKQWSGSKLGKEFVKVAHCHPAYLTYIQSTLCEVLDKTEKYQQPQCADNTTLIAENEKQLKKRVSCVGAKSQLCPTLCNYGL